MNTSIITDMVKAVQKREQEMLMQALREYGDEVDNGYEIHFDADAPYIACYVDDEPCDCRVRAVRTIRNFLHVLIHTETTENIPLRDIFAGQLESVIDAVNSYGWK